MKRTIITSVLLAIVVILAGCSGGSATDAGAGEPIKIIAAHNQTSTENPYHDGLLKFKEVAEEESDGRITVEVHAGTIGTAESELVEKLVIGAADVVLVSPGS